jgi:tRNA (adenine22-N1)-methyltransferase
LKPSARLCTVLSFIECETLADIGSDHALLPIAACLEGRAERALACDIARGPLARAEANIRKHGLEGKISARLGDGLFPVEPGEADCIVIAGMGGMRIAEILARGRETARAAKTLVLQPQRDAASVRDTLRGLGFIITDEATTADRGHFYTVIAATPS